MASWEERDEDPPPYHLGEYQPGCGGGGIAWVRIPGCVATGVGSTRGVVGHHYLGAEALYSGSPGQVMFGDTLDVCTLMPHALAA